jgi:hypothetical protein
VTISTQPAPPGATPPRRSLWTRETRLLLITVALSVAVLFLLARFRFPDQEPLELPAQPLQRLAARAAFDDLGAAVSRAAERVRPALRVIEVPATTGMKSLTLEDVLWRDPGHVTRRLALAYRFRQDAVIVLGQPQAWLAAAPAQPAVRASDDVRGLVVLEAAGEVSDGWQPPAISTLSSPQYLLIAEATYGGVALRPLFGGTADPFTDPLWDQPLLALGQDIRAADGAFVFTLEGSFAGAVRDRQGVHVLVPAEQLIRTAERLLSSGRRRAARIGVRLQHLGPGLRVATGATAGAVVSDVEPGSPAGSVIAPGDVITAVAGRRVGTPEDALLAIARLAVNAPAAIELRRNRERLVVTVTPVALEDPALVPLRDVLGVTLRRVATGARADVIEPGGAAAVGGMQEGDVVTWIDGTDAPTPQRVTAIWAALAPKESALVRIDRGGEPLVLALGRP